MARPKPVHEQTFKEHVQEEGSVSRIAVVLVHGQGEQTPMSDVAEFAETVWSTDPDVMAATPFWESDHHPRRGRLFSTPVYDADLSEQRRLVTQKLTIDGKKTVADFYQFYWADLMPGNRWEHVWVWFTELITRNRDADTPERLRPIRRLVMFLALCIAVCGLLYGLAALLNSLPTLARGGYAVIPVGAALIWLAIQWPFTLRDTLRRSRRKAAFLGGLRLIGLSLFVTLCIGVLEVRSELWPTLQADTLRLGDRAVQPTDRLASLARLASTLLTLFLMGVLAVVWPMWRSAQKSFLVPVMADSARMFRASPENIPNRDRVRRRGMELLEALHESERRYDRIIIVAHSLGTFVAYSIVAHYWGSVFKQIDHSSLTTEREAVERAGAALRRERSEANMRAWRNAVRDYGRALAQPKALPDEDKAVWRLADYVSESLLIRKVWRRLNEHRELFGLRRAPDRDLERQSFWRISDLITLGSPLTYAQMLMAESDVEFGSQLAQRRWPESPPQSQDPPSGTFMHQGQPHHAAVFAGTLWTNIYFKSRGLLKGDIVGGPVCRDPPKGLGRGVLDVCITPCRHHPKFAHNEYWRPPKQLDDDEGAPENVAALRAALNFFDRDQASDDILFRLTPRRFKNHGI